MSLILVLVATAAMAQGGRAVRGVVLDSNNRPIANATISAVGADESTTTGADGTFTLTVPTYTREVQAWFEGYLPMKLEVDGSYLMFKLKVDANYAKAKEQERIAAEKEAAAKAKAEEEARIAAEKQAEAERIAKEAAAEQARIAAEKEAAARARAEENARIAAEKQAEAERIAKEKAAEQARIAAEKEAAAKAKAEEDARIAAEKKAEAERKAKEKAAEQARKAAEKEAAAKAKAEEKEREAAARKAEAERIAKEKAAEQARIAAEKEAAAKAKAEEDARIATQKEETAKAEEERQAAEKEAAAKAKAEEDARIAAEKIAEAERIAKEKEEKAVAKKAKRDALRVECAEHVKGYESFVNLSYNKMNNNNYAGVDYIGGYRFNNYLFLGVGAGANMRLNVPVSYVEVKESLVLSRGVVYFPVYAHFRAQLLNRRCTPFLALSAGYNISLPQSFDLELTRINYNASGMFLNPQVGLTYRVRPKFGIYCAVGLNASMMPECITNTGYSATIKHGFKCGFNINLGISF